jgi:hypothetical protein
VRKCTFVVGRRVGRSTVVVFIGVTKSPIAGPFTVQAVVSTN